MSWLSELWKQEASDWTFVHLKSQGAADTTSLDDVTPNLFYLRVVLKSLRIVNVRSGFSKFFGTVHSSITVPRIGGASAFNLVYTPSGVDNADPENLDRILVMDRPLLHLAPYRGGSLDIEIGLYSVKEADLAAPYLKLLESIAGNAGVSFASAALPLAGPLKEGVSLLLGTAKQAVLEVGLSKTFSPVYTGTYIVMRAPKDLFPKDSLTVDSDNKLIDRRSGKTIGSYPYITFSIEKSPSRDNWFEIPEIASAYSALNDAVRGRNKSRVKDAQSAFRLIVLTSGELLESDAARLVKKVEHQIDQLLSPNLVNRGGRQIRIPDSGMPLLDTIKLFS